MSHSNTPSTWQDARQEPPHVDDADWHAIEFEDVAVTPKALDAIKQAARDILPKYVPPSAMENLTVADGLALLTRDLFWEEGSGRLYLCSEIGDRRICLHVPAEHWQFRVTGLTH